MCKEYRFGDVIRNKIAVLINHGDIAEGKTPKLKEIFYLSEYVKQPHMRGYFGKYPPPDYEIGIGFEINVDSGLPVPQNRYAYTQTYKTNRDFNINIQSTRFNLSEHFPPHAGFKTKSEIRVEDYEVIGQHHDMKEISYRSSIQRTGADAYIVDKSKNSDFFMKWRENELLAFMMCSKVTTFVKVAHCEHYQIIDGFLVKTRFKRSLMSDYETILRRSTQFFICLFKEN